MTTSRFFCGSWNYTPSTTRWRNLKTGRFILKMNQTFFVHTTPEKLKPNNQWSLWICFWRKLRKSHDYWLSWFHRFRIASRSKYSCSAAQFWREIVLSGAFIGRIAVNGWPPVWNFLCDVGTLDQTYSFFIRDYFCSRERKLSENLQVIQVSI